MRTLVGKKSGLLVLAAAASLSLLTPSAQAVPYASGISNVSGTVSFILNESADTVKIKFGATTTNLGALAAGTYSTNVGASTPFSIEVTKSSGAGYKSQTAPGVAGKIQISTDPATSRFPTPRGVAVNKNPKSPYFGRIYVANSTPGAAGGRSVGRGLYTLKADFSDSPNGYGTNAQTGGLTFAVSANSPYRLSVGADDYLYISDYSSANAGLFRLDGDLKNGERVLDYIGAPTSVQAPTNHGAILKAVAEGSLAGGDLKLYTIDEGLQGPLGNRLWRYDLNAGPLTNQSSPTLLSSALIRGFSVNDDFVKGGVSNYFYLMQNRQDPATVPVLYVVDTNGTTIANSKALWQDASGNPSANDALTNTQSIAISPDGQYLAFAMQSSGGGTTITILTLTNGIPDMSTRTRLAASAVIQGRGVDFDAAGNLYYISSGDAVLRAFSPGGFTIATTTFDGTSGSFAVVRPSTDVSIVPTAPQAIEGGTPVVFTITRVGDTTPALTVNYAISGTASNGVDYTVITNLVVIPAGQSSAEVGISALPDALAELTETVTLTLATSSNYNAATPTAATVAIICTNTPELTLTSTLNTMYERVTNDCIRVQLTRRGDTNTYINLDASSFICTGAAVSNVDYTLISPGGVPPYITFSPGDVNLNSNNLAYPLNNDLITGPKTFAISLAPGAGFNVATNVVNATIVDDDLGPETPVFSENFNDPAASNNWTVRFAANDGVEDKDIQWAYDYSLIGVPPAPHSASGDTLGLRLTVNKDATGAAAGVNLYPNGQSFSGDFALRFDMYLLMGSGSFTTEYALFGINHSGTKTNWFRNSGNGYTNSTYDGLWCQIEADGAALGDYVLNTAPVVNASGIWTPTSLASQSAANLTATFKTSPWSVGAGAGGVPANLDGTLTPTWADGELSQVGNVVTLKMNNTVIFQTNNTTAFNSGNIMLGYDDAYDSLGPAGACVIFDNVRVISLLPFRITSIKIEGESVVVAFTDSSPGPFKVEAATTVNGTFGEVAATIVSTGSGTYLAKIPYNGAEAAKYYRIKR